MPTEIDHAFATGSLHVRIADVPLERHRPVQHAGTAWHLVLHEGDQRPLPLDEVESINVVVVRIDGKKMGQGTLKDGKLDILSGSYSRDGKDMAGLCRPYAAHALVKALKDEVGLPIHFHTHDTSGINASSTLKAGLCGSMADVSLGIRLV